jgi:hypothetical protein
MQEVIRALLYLSCHKINPSARVPVFEITGVDFNSPRCVVKFLRKTPRFCVFLGTRIIQEIVLGLFFHPRGQLVNGQISQICVLRVHKREAENQKNTATFSFIILIILKNSSYQTISKTIFQC